MTGIWIYYNSVRTSAQFRDKAEKEDAANFATLHPEGRDGASSGSRKDLFACRVLVNPPGAILEPLRAFFLPGQEKTNGVIQQLANGPGFGITSLRSKCEPELVHMFDPDSVGYIWAAMGAVLRGNAEMTTASHSGGDLPDDEAPRGRPARQRKPPQLFTGIVRLSDIPRSPSSPPSTAASSSRSSSVRYTIKIATPAPEELTVRLISRFIRLVMNYAQDPKSSTILWFRDSRITFKGTTHRAPNMTATDDGGIDIKGAGKAEHAALLEAKKDFHTIIDGAPQVSDRALAQMALQALARHLEEEQSSVIIFAVSHYVKFFFFSMDFHFGDRFATLPINNVGGADTYMRVDSTDSWMDLTTRAGRKDAINHLIALAAWAKAKY